MTPDPSEEYSSHSPIQFRDPFSRVGSYEKEAMKGIIVQVEALDENSAWLEENPQISSRKELHRPTCLGRRDPMSDIDKQLEKLQQLKLDPESRLNSDDDGSYTPTNFTSAALFTASSELIPIQSSEMITTEDTFVRFSAGSNDLEVEDVEDFKALIVGVDGGVDSLKSEFLSRLRHSPIPSPSLPSPIVRSVSISTSVDGSNVYLQSYEDLGEEDNWDSDKLLELSDLVREALKGAISLCDEHFEVLLVVLRAMARSEQFANGIINLIDIESMVRSEQPTTGVANTIDIDAIKDSHFDKLLQDIRCAPPESILESKTFQEIQFVANVLEIEWMKRFRLAYTNLDHTRGEEMLRFGELRDVTLNPNVNGAVPWVVKNARTTADQEGGLSFIPGDWWLNMECAMRDGIVGAADQAVTKGRYGATALTLLIGEEEDGPKFDMYKYTKVGSMKDMLFALLVHRDPVRILRGSNLKSKYAPSVGIRYDGLYLLRQYGHKLIDEDENVYCCTLILDRVPGQKSFNDVLRVPYPSQIDDWKYYYEMVSASWTRKGKGLGCSKWFEDHEQQQKEKQEWVTNKNIKDGLQEFTMAPSN